MRKIEKIIVYEDIKDFILDLVKSSIFIEKLLSSFNTNIILYKARVKAEKIDKYLVVRLGNKLHLIDITKHNIELNNYDLIFYFRVNNGKIDKISFSEDIITETINEINDLFIEYKERGC
jgi:hypothetical protein